jgi:hypothetical protein
MTVNSYLHYLTRGQIRPVNYNGASLLGEYSMRLSSLENGILTEQSTMFTFYANGTITAAIRESVDGEEVAALIENALFRITSDNKVWLIANGSLGTMDITDILRDMFVKSGQDYSAVTAGSFAALNEESDSYASLIVIRDNGEISFTDGGGTVWTGKLNIKNANEYSCFLRTDTLYIIDIEVTDGGDTLRITLNGTEVLYYGKVTDNGGI